VSACSAGNNQTYLVSLVFNSRLCCTFCMC